MFPKKPAAPKASQTTIEYLLLFAVVAIITFYGFKNLLPKTLVFSNAYFNRVSSGIVGEPPPCFQRGQQTDISVNETNASAYFERAGMSAWGGNANCENNGCNRWCVWHDVLIGCYEIADDCDDGNCNGYECCDKGWINYRWKKERFAAYKDEIDAINITIDTHEEVCGSETDEGDDGLRLTDGPKSLTAGNNWHWHQCNSDGGGGFLEFQAYFDGDGLLDSITVWMGDHHDEGTVRITALGITFGPPIPGDCN